MSDGKEYILKLRTSYSEQKQLSEHVIKNFSIWKTEEQSNCLIVLMSYFDILGFSFALLFNDKDFTEQLYLYSKKQNCSSTLVIFVGKLISTLEFMPDPYGIFNYMSSLAKRLNFEINIVPRKKIYKVEEIFSKFIIIEKNFLKISEIYKISEKKLLLNSEEHKSILQLENLKQRLYEMYFFFNIDLCEYSTEETYSECFNDFLNEKRNLICEYIENLLDIICLLRGEKDINNKQCIFLL